jgi:hypothetical protein
VLVALGKRPGGPAAEGLTRRVRELARRWLAAERIEHLVVLRAHQQPAAAWRALAELTAGAQTRLWLVVDGGELPAGVAEVLAEWSARGPHAVAARPWPVREAMLPAPAPVATAATSGFPPVPDVAFALFRVTARRLLDPDAFARVDEVYRESFREARDAALAWHPLDPLRAAPQAVAALQRLTVAAATPQEMLARVRGAQAGFFAAGVLHELPAGADLRPRLDPGTMQRLRGLCSPASAAAVTISRATGQPGQQLAGLRLGDLCDTAAGLHLVIEAIGYQIPAAAAGLVRAAVHERRAALDAAADPACAPLFARADDAPLTEVAVDMLCRRAAAQAGVALRPLPFRDGRVIDLRRHEEPVP